MNPFRINLKNLILKIKQNYFLLALSLASLYISLSIYFGLILGYLSGRIFAGKKEKEPGIIKSLIFHLKDWRIHIHHWFWALGVLIFGFIGDFYFPHIVYGFLGGVTLHGIYSYNDWYIVIGKRVSKPR